jgi:hypothetical protein
MSIRQNEDRNYSKHNDNEISAFAKIKFIPNKDNELEERYHNWVEECAKTIKANSHTMEETEQFFLHQCDALPIDKEDYRIKNFQSCVIMNYFQHLLKNKQTEASFDMTDEQVHKYLKEQREIFREAQSYSQEYFGIQISGYYLPHTERNLYLYEEVIQDIQDKANYHEDINIPKKELSIYFFFDKKTGHMECNGGGRSLINKIIVFRGVGEEDINLRNNRFQGYLSPMHELGYIPGFRMD